MAKAGSGPELNGGAKATPFQSHARLELHGVTFSKECKINRNECRLFLAFRTEVAAASGNHDAFDRSFADEARLAFAAVDTVLQLEETFFAIGIDVVGNG